MKDPLVTIAIPFYNNRDTIVDAVKSVFAQDYKNWELFLVNDGSTDGSLEMVNQINDIRVQVVTDGINKGLICRLNQISRLGGGMLLARMDADDLMAPDRISKQVDFLLNHPDVDLVDTAAYSITETGKPCGIRGLEPLNYTPGAVIRKAMLIHATVMGNRKWFIDNPYDPDYTRAEDYELWCRSYDVSKFGRVTEPLYFIREGKINLKNYKDSLKTVRKIFRVYGQKMLGPIEVKIEITKTYLKVGLYNLLGAIKQQDFLSAKRNRMLDVNEKYRANEILTQIRQTPVTGWEAITGRQDVTQ
ncbi:MAG: glycosyltransferase family 2 protein [Sphingobacteriaceae bacterium]